MGNLPSALLSEIVSNSFMCSALKKIIFSEWKWCDIVALAYFSIMVTSSNKEKHQQFGLKLLFIAVIVALVFSIWYLSEKSDRSTDQPLENSARVTETR